MIAIKMPADDIRYVQGEELLWFRRAFDTERAGSVMLRSADDTFYSTESIDDLARKFTEAGVPLAKVTAPDADLNLYVNADEVRKIDRGNRMIFSDNAGSALVFHGKIRLAVREGVKEATSLLENARAKAFG